MTNILNIDMNKAYVIVMCKPKLKFLIVYKKNTIKINIQKYKKVIHFFIQKFIKFSIILRKVFLH